VRTIGSAPTARYCFGTSAPARVPRPAATTIAATSTDIDPIPIREPGLGIAHFPSRASPGREGTERQFGAKFTVVGKKFCREMPAGGFPCVICKPFAAL
jgi:hypothetical protein